MDETMTETTEKQRTRLRLHVDEAVSDPPHTMLSYDDLDTVLQVLNEFEATKKKLAKLASGEYPVGEFTVKLSTFNHGNLLIDVIKGSRFTTIAVDKETLDRTLA